MQAVGEGHPDEVAEGKHHAEAVGDQVDGGEDGGFHVQGVEGVDGLSNGDEDDGVGDAAKIAVLLHDEGEIHDDPTKHARSEFAEGLDVDFTEDGQGDAGVQLTANEPVVQNVTGVATSSEFTLVGVLGVLDAEGGDITIGSKEVGDQNVASQDADKIVADEGPDREFRAMGNGSSAK